MISSRNEGSGWHVAVLIPARDEEVLLPRCLCSVLAACRVLPGGTTSDIIVVSDRSSDSTGDIARSMLEGSGAAVESAAGSAGLARAQAAQVALSRIHGAARDRVSRIWLANTDADCEVPDTWLMHQLAVAGSGYQAVAGTVDVDSFGRSRYRDCRAQGFIADRGSSPDLAGEHPCRSERVAGGCLSHDSDFDGDLHRLSGACHHW